MKIVKDAIGHVVVNRSMGGGVSLNMRGSNDGDLSTVLLTRNQALELIIALVEHIKED
jgi:hypothetical protein